MKSTLIILPILLLAVLANGQTSGIYTSQVDSVQALLDKLPKTDTLRVIELNRLARLCIYDLQYERGLTAATEARELAKAIKYPQGEGMYLRTLDVLHYDDRLQAPYHILTYWSFADLKKTEYPINIQSSDQVDKTKRNAALASATIALDIMGNKEMAAHADHLLAFNYLEEKNNEKALEFIEKAERIFIDLRLGIPLMESKSLKARILKAAGRDLEVRNEELQMAQIAEAHRDERERALLYSIIGGYYFFNTEQLDICLDYFLKSVHILEPLGEKYFLAFAYYTVGVTFQWLDFPQKSVEFFAKSFDLIQSGKINDSWLGFFYPFYIQRLIEVGEVEKAEEIFAIGKLVRTEKDYQLQNQGALLMGKGQYSKAIEMFYDLNELQGIIRGEPGNPDVWTDYYIANCLRSLGKWKESNRFAIASYQQAIQIGFRKADAKKACLLLYENYEDLGQADKALEYLRIYTEWVKKDKLQDLVNRATKMEIQSVIDKSDQEKRCWNEKRFYKKKQIRISGGGCLVLRLVYSLRL